MSQANLSDLRGNVPAKRQEKQEPKTIVDLLVDPMTRTRMSVLAGKFLTADRMLRLCVNAIKKTPLLMQCDPQSVLGAMMASAALGLEPNTTQQQAFLIPYKKRAQINGQWVDVYECQFQIGYRGFITLVHRSPRIDSIEAEAIHEGDHFKQMQGSKNFLEYAKALKGRGDLIGAYSLAKLTNGNEIACVLPLDEIHKIRSRSETYNALVRKLEAAENEKERAKASQKLADTPWVLWEDDMAAKSAIKKLCKQLPIAAGDMISAAAELDSANEAGVIDMSVMTDPEVVRAVVEDGIEPPADTEQKDSAAPVLENQQAETIPAIVVGQAREERPVEAKQEADPPRQRRQMDVE